MVGLSLSNHVIANQSIRQIIGQFIFQKTSSRIGSDTCQWLNISTEDELRNRMCINPSEIRNSIYILLCERNILLEPRSGVVHNLSEFSQHP